MWAACKSGVHFPMVILPEFRMRQHRVDDHWGDVLHFSRFDHFTTFLLDRWYHVWNNGWHLQHHLKPSRCRLKYDSPKNMTTSIWVTQSDSHRRYCISFWKYKKLTVHADDIISGNSVNVSLSRSEINIFLKKVFLIFSEAIFDSTQEMTCSTIRQRANRSR